jgi:UPF0755 protein
MSKRSFRGALAIVIGSIALALSVCGYFVQRACTYPGRAHDGSAGTVDVEITSGMSFSQIARMLADNDVVSKPTWFRIYWMWRGEPIVKPGKYHLASNLTPEDLLDTLMKGVKEVTTRVTIPEGRNMLEVFKIIEDANIAKASELVALARDKDFLAKYAIAGDSIEGYLFPDTYEFVVPSKPTRVLDKMITTYQRVWRELSAKHDRSLQKVEDKLHWSDRDVLVLASIVEKEAVDPNERSRIAQVFVNRMTMSEFKSKRLETDPTIRYGCEVPVQRSKACDAWDRGRLHDEQLKDEDNPYNTYRHPGLPPGPISNPGKASIAAAMSPDGSEYLYFVAKDARNHVFARTFEEHDRNVDKYQRHKQR